MMGTVGFIAVISLGLLGFIAAICVITIASDLRRFIYSYQVSMNEHAKTMEVLDQRLADIQNSLQSQSDK